MKKGDLCFFYHSNIGKEIVGIVQVIKEAFKDPTDKKKSILLLLRVKYKKTFTISKSVSLSSIKKHPYLKELLLVKQSRLSVMPIDTKSWKIINKISNIRK